MFRKKLEIDGRIGVAAIVLTGAASVIAIVWLKSILLYVVLITTCICIGQFTRAKERW